MECVQQNHCISVIGVVLPVLIILKAGGVGGGDVNTSCEKPTDCVTTMVSSMHDLTVTVPLDVVNPLYAYQPTICDTRDLWNADYKAIQEHSIQTDHHKEGGCNDIDNIFIARAITDILLILKLGSATVIYDEKFKAQIDTLQSIKLKDEIIKFNTWQLGNKGVTTDKIMAKINAYDYIPAIVILADYKSTVEIIYQGRQRNLTSFDWTWIVSTGVSGKLYQPHLRFGDKIIFIDYSATPKYIGGFEDIQKSYDLWYFAMTTETMQRFGKWSYTTGVPGDILYLWEFTRFENKNFNITSIELPVFHYTVVKDGVRQWEGICIEILKTLATTLNFNYTITPSIDKKWGAPADKKGKWNGMVGMVYRKEVEWGLAKFTVTSIRDTVIDYSMSFWHEPAVIVMKKPVGDSIFLYFGPFRWEVWFTLCLTIPFMGTFVAVSVQMDQRRPAHKKKHPFYKQWYLSSWVCFGIMVQQGSKWEPRSQSTRLMIGFYWFFSIVAAATYTGNLIAVLAVPQTKLPVQTLEDLAKQSKYSYGTMWGAAISTLIEHSSFQVYQNLWANSMNDENNNVKSHKEGLLRVKNEANYIYLGEKAGVAPTVYSDCAYAIGKEEFFPSSMAFIFPDKSPLIPIFNKKIANMIETGMVERWKRMYHPRDECSATREGSGEAATIKETQGGFILLCGCVSLAGVLLILEYAYRKGHLDKYIKLKRLKSFNIHKQK